jgi:bacteriorhodopsin
MGPSSYKWGYFVVSTVLRVFVAGTLVLPLAGRKYSLAVDQTVAQTYIKCYCVTILSWLLLTVTWSLSEGGNVISSDKEAIIHGIADILAKPIFSALLLWGHHNINPVHIGLKIYLYHGPSGRENSSGSDVPGGNNSNK